LHLRIVLLKLVLKVAVQILRVVVKPEISIVTQRHRFRLRLPKLLEIASPTEIAFASLHLLPLHHILIVSFVRRIPAAFVPLSGVFDLLNPVEVLNCDQLLAEIIVKELFVASIPKDFLLFQLSQKDVSNLACRQLAISVQSESHYFSFIILIDFDFVLHHFNSCLENTFVLVCVTHFNFLRMGDA